MVKPSVFVAPSRLRIFTDADTTQCITADERRLETGERIRSGRLPAPRWITVHPDSKAKGTCDGCGEGLSAGDYTFTVGVQNSLTFKFHDECFDVYNRYGHSPR